MIVREALNFKVPAAKKNLVLVHVVIAFGAERDRPRAGPESPGRERFQETTRILGY
jgi:hypothetical protein